MRLLGAKLYDPSTAGSASTASLLAMTAIDTTNLRIAFTIPSHGMVRVKAHCIVHGATTFPTILLGVLEGSTVRCRISPEKSLGNTAVATAQVSQDLDVIIIGLTPGAVNWDLAYGVEVVIASTAIKWGGPNDTTTNNAFGGITFEVWDPDPWSATGTPVINTNVTQVSGDATAADNAESFFDGTGYAGTNNTIPTVTNVTTVNGLAANVITATSINNDAITAAKIATGAIDADAIADNAIDAGAIAADAITEIQNGLATPTNIIAGTITTVTNLTNNNDKTGYSLVATTGLGNQTANITGNLSGSVGSVTAGVTVTTNNDKSGYALSSAGIQAIWDVLTSALTTVGSIGKLLVDNINATISSRSSHSAADVWAVATRLLTAGTNIVLAKGVGITGFNDLSAGDVRTAIGLASANLDTQLSNIQSDTNDIQSRIPATLSGDGFMKADLKSIEDELTSGNNATLNLKKLSVINSDDYDPGIYVQGGKGIYAVGFIGGNFVDVDNAEAGMGLYILGGTGGAGVGEGSGAGVVVSAGSNGGAGGATSIVFNATGSNKSINAPNDIAVSDGDLTLANIAQSILKYDFSSITGEAARSVINALRKLRNKISFNGTNTLTVYKEDGTTSAYTQTVTSDSDQEPFKELGN